MISTESHPENGRMTKGDVLVVDDNSDNLRLLTGLLTKKGYKVRPAPSGSLALKSVQSTLPDLVLLDIKMPGMDGYEVCRRLKADERTRDVPVLFISGLTEMTDKIKGFGVGGVDYITKPFQYEEVLARVETHVSLARMHKRLQQEIMERKRTQKALKKANEELEQRVKERTFELTAANEQMGHEIEERKRTEEAIIRAKKEWEETFDAVPDLIAIIDNNYRILRANKAMAERLGVTVQETKGLTCYRCVHGTDGPPEFCPHAKLLKDGQEHTAEVREEQLGGWFLVTTSPIHDGNGLPIKSVHVARDITESKLAEQALRESEEKFRNITSSAQDAIVMMDDEGYISFWNDAAQKTFGYSRQEALGKELHILLAPQRFYEAYRKGFGSFKRTGRGMAVGKTLELTAVKKDGTEFPIELSLSAVKQKDKWNAISIIRDISKRKQVEEALQESEEKYRDLYENAPIAYFSINPVDGSILRCNNAAMSLLGYDRESFLGIKVFDLYADTPKGLSRAIEIFEHLKAGESIKDVELQMQNKDGSPVWVSLSVESVRDRDGNATESRSMVMDISDRKRLEGQLRQTQKMEAIGTLAGGIAHDFNNILFPIIGFAEMTIDDLPEDGFARNSLAEILKAAGRARGLVKQILAFARQSEQEKKPIRVSPIVKEALKLLRASLPSTIEIQQDIVAEPGVILADPTQIHQIVMNLCTNAYHAMEETGGILSVSLAEMDFDVPDMIPDNEMAQGKYLQLTVGDTGHGMASNILEKIFDPYFTTKGKGKGTGMGLSVVHGIVKDHSGHIFVDSAPGKGTIFQVFFPLLAVGAGEIKAAAVETAPTGSEHILLVDDEPQIIKMLSQMLAYLGYRVTSCTGSLEALEIFRNTPDQFDLLITDLTMPEMTGEKLAQKVKGIKPELPVILCTGFSESMTKEKADAMGINALIFKPVVKNEMAKTIRAVIEKQRKT